MPTPLGCGKGGSLRSPQRPGLLWLACALAAMGMAPAQAQTASETVLHNFKSPPKGANPAAGVIRDPAGNLYGTTSVGGTANAGVVYRLDTAGHETVLYSFTGGADGNAPVAGVIGDSAGNLYGTTEDGGTAGAGAVYKLDTARQETVLYSFTRGADGGFPQAGVIRDSAGNLYGTTFGGGMGKCLPLGCGVVFKLDTASRQTVLYSFTGGADGGTPTAGVIRDSAGNLYGTTYSGGTGGAGVVYELDAAGHETALYSFTGGADGGFPSAGVIPDSAGNLYGTTEYGGTAGLGVVFKLDTAGHQTVLYSFTNSADGSQPAAGVIRDSAGNLYGTTYSGGTGGAGVVYELDAAGQETVVYSFPSAVDGALPIAGVIRDSAGNLYGTTVFGGTANAGVVYKLDATGHETVLYTFTGGADGNTPWGGVIRDSAGNLYGTTSGGGPAGAGAVYRLDTAGNYTVLYSFTGGADGGNPYAGVIRDSAGNLYGTTAWGGTAYWGVVYKLDTAGHETVLYSFTGGTDGGYPRAGVIRDSAGNLYGTTDLGGTAGAGVVYRLDTAGNETVLYSFTGPDGENPIAGVIRDSSGNLYGATSAGGPAGAGVVFKLDTAANYTVLYGFTGGADGQQPQGGVVRDAAGNLYGTALHGGAFGGGAVYKLDATGHETVLYSFTGGADGSQPSAGVIRDSAGNLYGTTGGGGKEGAGVVFKLKPQ